MRKFPPHTSQKPRCAESRPTNVQAAPLKAVQELLAHATIEMTMRYAHLSPDTRRDAVALLDLGAQREAMGRQKSGSGSSVAEKIVEAPGTAPGADLCAGAGAATAR